MPRCLHPNAAFLGAGGPGAILRFSEFRAQIAPRQVGCDNGRRVSAIVECSRFAVAGEFDKLRFAVAGHYREKQKRHFVIAITRALEGVNKVKWS
jgi:hypothetical protein